MSTQWKEGVFYNAGDVVEYNGAYFMCRQAHTSQSNWAPSVHTLALWLPTQKPGPPVDPDPPTGDNPSDPGDSPDDDKPPGDDDGDGDKPTDPGSGPTPPDTSTDVILAPYLYIWGFKNNVYKINSCMDYYNKTGGKVITMAFILADHNQS